MTKDFSHIEFKLCRVRRHTEEIAGILKDFLESQFFDFVLGGDQTGRLTIHFGKVTPIPEEVSILVGEAAHHLRSALDHIAFNICQPITPQDEMKIQFPIVDRLSDFEKQISQGRLKGADDHVIKLIEYIQPYNTRDRMRNDVLSELRDLNNLDKHRRLAICVSEFSTKSINIRILNGDGSIIGEELFHGHVEEGTLVARFQPTGFWTAGTRVIPAPEFQLFPVFGATMPASIAGKHPLDVISTAGRFIEFDLIPNLKMSL